MLKTNQFRRGARNASTSGGRNRPLEKKLSSESFKQIRIGDATRLYLWGVVSYVDAFGERRETKFRLMHGGPESKRNTMWWCDEGNEAT